MTAPTKAQIERAERIAREIVEPGTTVLHGAIYMAARDAALAAIIETQEADARIAERKFADAGWSGNYFNAGLKIAAAIREGADQ